MKIKPEFTISTPRNLIETSLLILALLALLFALYDVFKIFFGVFTFAIIFYSSFAGPFERLVWLLANQRKLAGIIYALILILVIALPFIFMITALGKHIGDIAHWMEAVKTHGVPPLPEKITKLPYTGESIAEFWHHLQENPQEALIGHKHQIKDVLHHLLTGGLGLLGTGLQLIFGIVVSAFFLAGGNEKLAPVKLTLQQLLGTREGLLFLDAIDQAIKGVSVGVIGTAFFAAVFSWIGFAIAGIHFKLILTALVFFFVLLQMGPLLIWLPLVIWASMQGHTATTVFLIVYGLCLLIAEGLLKPILIAKSGGKIPFLVLFIGVTGGLAAWGFTGMFKGAIIMAVSYTIFNSWLKKKQRYSKA
ncbi:AI-2E family transporter [Pedobacter sp. ISL-68]|uniref:AI-2E family transporter n=1 Tax=unclassified Pedobacter TaxID=2628915 RepID=UPI001BE90DC0|nr:MULTISPECIES: AI-2E family transporter [unclassified Pedobacter]MBT2561363.1 AI-2E family transporter [Pedobacter sp. ISL-64]MBT2590752.1 AI-2E family transporter [Pedobacter sp. ISL-68]